MKELITAVVEGKPAPITLPEQGRRKSITALVSRSTSQAHCTYINKRTRLPSTNLFPGFRGAGILYNTHSSLHASDFPLISLPSCGLPATRRADRRARDPDQHGGPPWARGAGDREHTEHQ